MKVGAIVGGASWFPSIAGFTAGNSSGWRDSEDLLPAVWARAPQSLTGDFWHFGPCGAGFGRRSLSAIFQFPIRRSADRFDCRPGEESGQRLSDAASLCLEMQDAAHSTVEITSEMVEAAALVLQWSSAFS